MRISVRSASVPLAPNVIASIRTKAVASLEINTPNYNYNGSSESFLAINSTLISSILLEPCCRKFPALPDSTGKTSNHQRLSQACIKSQRTSIWSSQLIRAPFFSMSSKPALIGDLLLPKLSTTKLILLSTLQQPL